VGSPGPVLHWVPLTPLTASGLTGSRGAADTSTHPHHHRSNACGPPCRRPRTALPTRINVAFSAMLALISLAALVLKLR
jgi:hypothetical protein